MMTHYDPFEVGKINENRQGLYEVIAIKPALPGRLGGSVMVNMLVAYLYAGSGDRVKRVTPDERRPYGR